MSKRSRKANPPVWCKKHFAYNQWDRGCCYCGNFTVVYQEGDGLSIHSLCEKCYPKLKALRGSGK